MSDSDPRPSFRWNCGSSRGDALALDAGLHASDLGHVVVGEGTFPHEGADQSQEAFAERPVTGHHPGAQQGLAFPGLGPPVEVRLIARQVARQTTLAAFGTQSEVDGGHALGGTRPVDEAQEGFGRFLAEDIGPGDRVVEDEEDVEVAGVGHLGPAQATHADHAEGDGGGDVGHRRLEDSLGHVGQGRSRAGHVVDVEEVAGGDTEHLVLGEPDQSRPAPRLVARPGQAFDGVVDQCRAGSGSEAPVVIEVGDQFGVVFDGLAHDAARPEDQAQAPGRFGGFAERGDHEGTVMAPDHERPEAEEAEVGVGGDRQPVEQQREELTHQAGGPCESAGQLFDRGARALGVAETEGGQAPGHGVGRHDGATRRVGVVVGPGRRRLQGGEGLEQRPEEEALVDDPDVGLVAPHGVVEVGRRRGGGSVGEAEDAGQAPTGGGVGGQRVGLLLLDQLEPVLHRAQEAVGVGQDAGVLTADVAAGGQLVQRAESGPVPDGGVVMAVHQLQELHRELHVADAPGTALDLAPGEASTRPLGFGAGLHGPQLGQLVG